MRRSAVLLLLLWAGAAEASAQQFNMAAASAAQDFRWGVDAFNNGLFNKSILSLEKSLTENPDDPQTKTWLGRAYYRSGFVENALQIWKNLIASGAGGALLQDQVSTIMFRRGLGNELTAEAQKYVLAQSIQGMFDKYNLFYRPSAVTPLPAGGSYVASFASNDVLELDANGNLVGKLRAGLWGFDHPFDVLDGGNGFFYVSEYGADRITRCNRQGGQLLRFGGRGLGDGQLLGPQYLAADGEGYLYVTDVGNRRVSKFDLNGKYVLTFGTPTDQYPGLRSPSGIAVYDQRIFVADHDAKNIAVFDESGNFVGTEADGLLGGPDGLSAFDNSGDLLVSDGTRILLYNVDTQVLTVLADLAGTAGRIVKTVRDANGDLLASDFGASMVYVLTQYSAMYSGLAVRIDRVDSQAFPKVVVNVTVSTRQGKPLTGLELRNFDLSESGTPALQPKLLFKGMNGDGRIVILVDRSTAMQGHAADIQTAVLAVLKSLSGRGRFQIVSAGENPTLEAGPQTEPNTAAEAAAINGTYTDGWRPDLGLRFAASQLIPKEGKSAIVFLTDGQLGANAFEQYTFDDTLQYLQNNNIRLYAITLDASGDPSEELMTLCKESGGSLSSLYQPEGVGGIIDDLLASRDGTYVLTYTSQSPTNFGNAFIPLEVEAHYFARSGRDDLGYYAPLEY